jgi:hypothetical protein
MASLRAATLAIVGGLFGSVAVGDLVAGCSSGDTTEPGDSGGDGSSTDVTTNPEAAGDSKANDVTRADATEGEMTGAMQAVFGSYTEAPAF